MRFLPFTYDEPNEHAPPEMVPADDRSTPAAFWWRPSIACTSEQIDKQRSLFEPCSIPWDTMNIAEIRVESRRAYEILNRIAPVDEDSFFVRILPPAPADTLLKPDTVEDVSLFIRGYEPERDLAIGIAAGLWGEDESIGVHASRDADDDRIRAARVAVFVHISDATSGHLRTAIESGTRIVSADGGAAVEYLTRYAPPGSWHVVHSWDARHWIGAIRDLQGKPGELYQTTYVDQTPYIKAY